MITPFGPNFELLRQELVEHELSFFLASTTLSTACPGCQQLSTRKYSRTKRKVRDLPITQRQVVYHIQLTKWFCDVSSCEVRIFTERLPDFPPYQRHTTRALDCLQQLAFQMNCVQAAKISHHLSLPVSHDTLLRLIYQTPTPIVFSPFRRK